MPFVKAIEIISALLSWFLAAASLLWEFIYTLANVNPHGSSTPLPMPLHLFFMPVAAVALAVFVLCSTCKRGIIKQGVVALFLPLAASLIAILGAAVACNNAG
jgi:hypothetical protein